MSSILLEFWIEWNVWHLLLCRGIESPCDIRNAKILYSKVTTVLLCSRYFALSATDISQRALSARKMQRPTHSPPPPNYSKCPILLVTLWITFPVHNRGWIVHIRKVFFVKQREQNYVLKDVNLGNEKFPVSLWLLATSIIIRLKNL